LRFARSVSRAPHVKTQVAQRRKKENARKLELMFALAVVFMSC
jgi:hypothetical protein